MSIRIDNVLTPSADQMSAVIRGMRNPKNSWDRIDSQLIDDNGVESMWIGPDDKELMKKLADGGPVHGKYLRMMTVYMDITAPLYWWKEFDTYKVGTVANSCSTMHKITSKEFGLEDFSHEHLIGYHEDEPPAGGVPLIDESPLKDGSMIFSPLGILQQEIQMLNKCREKYLATKDKTYWWQLIQLLPSSYNQKRTVMLNYEVLRNIYYSRKDHKLDEWHYFCGFILKLPMAELIIPEMRSIA